MTAARKQLSKWMMGAALLSTLMATVAAPNADAAPPTEPPCLNYSKTLDRWDNNFTQSVSGFTRVTVVCGNVSGTSSLKDLKSDGRCAKLVIRILNWGLLPYPGGTFTWTECNGTWKNVSFSARLGINPYAFSRWIGLTGGDWPSGEQYVYFQR